MFYGLKRLSNVTCGGIFDFLLTGNVLGPSSYRLNDCCFSLGKPNGTETKTYYLNKTISVALLEDKTPVYDVSSLVRRKGNSKSL